MRAFAALSVVVFHLNKSMHYYNLPELRNIDLAGYGVTMFFALSGFLITYLLLEEKETGEINLRKFYFRRILRIWPLYFLVLFVSILTALYYTIDLPANSIYYYLFMLANIPFIFDFALPFLGHFWSIAVEEQFYLFWPLVIKYKGNLVRVISGFTLIYFLVRVFFRYLDYRYSIPYPYAFINVNRFDCMAIGAIGAVLFFQKNNMFLRVAKSVFTQIVCLGIIILIFFNVYHTASVIDQELIACVTVFIIINVSNNPTSILKLNGKFFDLLGKCSYGIYLTHQLVIFYFSRLLLNFRLEDGLLKYVIIYSGVIGTTILISYLSYNYFESPFLRIKQKFQIIKSKS
jgi:peptidoglycan/LPS O-acetylase OafA/YrhL